jgi:glycosyltransferase involved in cell wall biosynthesis
LQTRVDPVVCATVLIPTHDHGETLRRTIASVRAQTVQDFELLVVGDGAPPQTRALIAELTATDPRIRYFDHPKGEGHGEAYRAAALAEAQGEIVCYLGDDDLWLPEHLATMSQLLKEADFAHTLHTEVVPGDTIQALGGSLDCASTRQRMLGTRWNFFGPTCAGHTLAAYRQLPHGWRPRPEGVYSDLHMWRQWLEQPGCRFRSEPVPTALHFASPARKGWSIDERLGEMDRWLPRLTERGFAAWLGLEVMRDWQRRVERPDPYARLGHLLLEKESWAKAELALRKAIDVNPADAASYRHLGTALERQGRIAEALEVIAAGINAAPTRPDLHNYLGHLLGKQGRWVEAEQASRRAIALHPTGAGLHALLGVALLQQGRLAEALAAAQEAARLAPEHPWPRQILEALRKAAGNA